MLAPSSKDGNFGARDEVAAKNHLHWNTGEGKRFRAVGTRGEESGRGIKTQGRKTEEGQVYYLERNMRRHILHMP